MTALYDPASPPTFSADFTYRDDVIALHGELDIATAPMLDEALKFADVTVGDMVLDLSDLLFIDSIGLTHLVMALRRLRPGSRLVLRAPIPAVRRVLEVSGLDQVFRVEN